MSARIGNRTWTCDCCGAENDQSGCVKGPPSCECYFGTMLGPDFCFYCRKCPKHHEGPLNTCPTAKEKQAEMRAWSDASGQQ